MKSLVYETEVETEEDILTRLVTAAGEIRDTPQILQRVVRKEMLKRCRGCVQSHDNHFEPFLN